MIVLTEWTEKDGLTVISTGSIWLNRRKCGHETWRKRYLAGSQMTMRKPDRRLRDGWAWENGRKLRRRWWQNDRSHNTSSKNKMMNYKTWSGSLKDLMWCNSRKVWYITKHRWALSWAINQSGDRANCVFPTNNGTHQWLQRLISWLCEPVKQTSN